MARKDRARPGGARSNLYDDITDKIIAELEEGRLPWVQPWGTAAAKAPLAMPRNAATARQYSGINVLILWGAVVQHGYRCGGGFARSLAARPQSARRRRTAAFLFANAAPRLAETAERPAMSRRAIVWTMAAAGALIVAPHLTGHGPRFIWNASASAPIGLYSVRPVGRLEVGDLVAVMPPDDLAGFLDARAYLPRGVPLIKRVLALPGTQVCRKGAQIMAYDHAYGEARERDSRGRQLPSWQGCRVIANGDVFLMNWDTEDSLDGRYFGPLPLASVTARVVPIWTDENGDGRLEPQASTR